MSAFEFYYTVSSDDIRPYMPDVPILLPASSFVQQRRNGEYYLRKPNLPEHVSRRAADCGGFVASRIWGEYRYSLAQYVEWLRSWSPQWSACMDYCCEPELEVETRERQDKTTANAWQAWNEYRDVPWVWVPTIQGLEPDDYRRHAREMKGLIREMQTFYADRPFRVGIGTLCRRANEQMIRRVVNAVVDELGDVPIHLWGVKLGYLQSSIAMPEQIVSVDSAAWNSLFYRDRQKWKDSGLTQRRYTWGVAHGAYKKKVEEALSEPKQQLLFLSEEVV